MSDIIQFDYKDHWQEEEINLERPNSDDKLLGFSIAGGIDKPFFNHHFTFIIVTNITENSVAYRDKRLKLYDLILRINDIDFTNIKHQTAVDILRTSGQKIQLLIRRLSPSTCEEIELEHDGNLGISITGGIGNNHFQEDFGIFITNIRKHQANKQLYVGDRLLQISSTSNTYDLRFVTHEIAKKCIQLACEESQTIKLYVAHTRPAVEVQKTTVLRQNQYDPLGSEEEDFVQVNKNNYSFVPSQDYDIRTEHRNVNHETNEQNLIMSFDFDDYQRYENRVKVRKNDLFNSESNNSAKVLLAVKRKERNAIKYATAPTVIDLEPDYEVNADVTQVNNTNRDRNYKVDDSDRNNVIGLRAVKQLNLNEAAIRDAQAEELRRKQSRMSQTARLNKEGAAGGNGPLRWQVE